MTEQSDDSAGAAGSRRRGAEATVQLNTRVAPEVAALVERVVAETGMSKREVVERAITKTYRRV